MKRGTGREWINAVSCFIFIQLLTFVSLFSNKNLGFSNGILLFAYKTCSPFVPLLLRFLGCIRIPKSSFVLWSVSRATSDPKENTREGGNERVKSVIGHGFRKQRKEKLVNEARRGESNLKVGARFFYRVRVAIFSNSAIKTLNHTLHLVIAFYNHSRPALHARTVVTSTKGKTSAPSLERGDTLFWVGKRNVRCLSLCVPASFVRSTKFVPWKYAPQRTPTATHELLRSTPRSPFLDRKLILW